MGTVVVGIIGYNEEHGIGRLLDSLLPQTLWSLPGAAEVVVVSNGSTDRMVEVAREKLAAFSARGIPARVVSLAAADKCAAWNHLVHEARPGADTYLFLDADVVVTEADGLEALLAELRSDPACRICGARIVNRKGEVIDRHVDGKCYAARGDILADVAIPRGVVMDDTFVAVTIVTNWYETDFPTGMDRGLVRRLERVIVRYGEAPRDVDKAYWLSVGRRTLIGTYVQAEVDFCMRRLLGGGEAARKASIALHRGNPDWLWNHLTHAGTLPRPQLPRWRIASLPKDLVKAAVALYTWFLARRGIRTAQFGTLAWRLPHKYW